MDLHKALHIAEAIVPMLKDAIVALAAIVGGVVAVVGLNVWRRQLKGTTEYQIASKVLKATFAFEDAINDARYPRIFPGEMAGRVPAEGESSAESKILNDAYAYHKRLEVVRTAQVDFHLADLEARAILGDGARKALEPLYKASMGLQTNYDLYFSMGLQDARLPRPEAEDRALKEMRETLFYIKGQDKFGEGVKKTVQSIEDEFREHLK